MLPIGNLTVFLSVPPSYQYLHSPFTFHPFTHSLIHISPLTIHHSPLTTHHSLIHHSLIHHSLILPLFFWSSSEKHPFIRRAPEGLSNNIRRKVETRWTNLVKSGQTWTKVDKHGQRWTSVDKRGQTWTKVVRTGQVWTNMDKHGQTWTKVVKSGQNWSNNAG